MDLAIVRSLKLPDDLSGGKPQIPVSPNQPRGAAPANLILKLKKRGWRKRAIGRVVRSYDHH